jgi:hypothetical protein
MLNHESVAKPPRIGLNMHVDPFLCLLCQWAEQEDGSFVAHQYVGRSLGFDFHVISFAGPFHLPHLPWLGGHRGTLSCPRLAEMPRGHPALDANPRLESQIVRKMSMALP